MLRQRSRRPKVRLQTTLGLVVSMPSARRPRGQDGGSIRPFSGRRPLARLGGPGLLAHHRPQAGDSAAA
jgi:hypothetical protein